MTLKQFMIHLILNSPNKMDMFLLQFYIDSCYRMSFKYFLLGSSEQVKIASHYVCLYVGKNDTSAESIDVIYEAMEHAKKHTSIAKDTGTNTRFVQYVLAWILNKLGSLIEIFDTQAASALLGLEVSLFTESYVF